MATAKDYATWIINNPEKKGLPDFETVVRAYNTKRREEQAPSAAAEPAQPDYEMGIPGFAESAVTPEGQYVEPPMPKPEPTMGEQAIGVAETGAAIATGATAGMGGQVRGALFQLAEEIESGKFGTADAAQRIKQAAQQLGAEYTYQPRTEQGQQMTQAAGEFAGRYLDPLAGMIGLAGVPTPTRGARPITQRGPAPRLALPSPDQPQPLGGMGVRSRGPSPEPGPTPSPAPEGRPAWPTQEPTVSQTERSVGAAQTPETLRRVAIAESMPVQFTGETGLTLGQASRDFELLRDEKELSKNPELGRRLRERAENQSAALQQNFDFLFETIGPRSVEDRDIGQAVDRALVTRMKIQKKKVDNLYDKARKEGEMMAPVEMTTMPDLMFELIKNRNSGNSIDIQAEILRTGAVIKNADGSYSPGTIALNDAEILRQDVNNFTDIYAPKEARIRRIAINAIDKATKDSGGPIYQDARKARAKFAQEFENVGITKRLLAEKKGTSERTIAFEDVFKKIILESPIEEINKLRVTLLKGGSEGKQAWQDLKAQLIDNIKQSSLSGSGSDSRGLPLLSPDKLSKKIAELDRRGKLEALYGKKQAQTIRDLGEIARVIYTAPPGAVNSPGTTSALMVAIDAMGGFMVSGVPVPAATLIREGAKYSKNKALIARVEEILKPVR
jgi:hypothetical protein